MDSSHYQNGQSTKRQRLTGPPGSPASTVSRVAHETQCSSSLGVNRTVPPSQDLLLASPEIDSDPSRDACQRKLEPNSIVCFGMIPLIAAKCDLLGSRDLLPISFSVRLESSTSFVSQDHPNIRGQIQTINSQMMKGLLEEKTLVLHGTCTLIKPFTTKKAARSSVLLDSNLELTIYGPLDIFDEIGPWFENYDVYLQDPKESHLQVPYCNPQRLSSDGPGSCPMLADVVSQKLRSIHLQDITEKPELLDVLSSHLDLDEAPQPSAIRGILRRHQKQALTFMLHREQGWDFRHQNTPDMWEILDTDQDRFFFNGVSGNHQIEEPLQFRGGVIADPMGLGKTLTMIALAATDLENHVHASALVETQENPGNKPFVPVTLIIVPPPLLGTWEEQLSEHVIDGGLRYLRHHGKVKANGITELEGVNIILTTYHTIAAEWDSGRGAPRSILFSVCHKRVILDEAHFIRNGSSKMAKAICVTGTPIQNRLGDLATLLRFIRAYPYNDPKCFETDISKYWKLGEDEEAVKRLKRLSRCLLLRRI